MLCLSCNKNKITTSKVMRHGDYGLIEVDIQTRCLFCKTKERQIEELENQKYELEDKLHIIQKKLTEMEYKLFTHIHGSRLNLKF